MAALFRGLFVKMNFDSSGLQMSNALSIMYHTLSGRGIAWFYSWWLFIFNTMN